MDGERQSLVWIDRELRQIEGGAVSDEASELAMLPDAMIIAATRADGRQLKKRFLCQINGNGTSMNSGILA